MDAERMELVGSDRARYFAPTAICGYLALICLALIVTSAFLSGMHDALALTAAGIFGLVLSGGLGTVFWRAQRRDLEFRRVATPDEAARNFEKIRSTVEAEGWQITEEARDRQLLAVTAGSAFSPGERVAVRFRGHDVLVASICDPGVGFSLVGRGRCERHRALIVACLGASSGH